jgi:hypothetical protein
MIEIVAAEAMMPAKPRERPEGIAFRNEIAAIRPPDSDIRKLKVIAERGRRR